MPGRLLIMIRIQLFICDFSYQICSGFLFIPKAKLEARMALALKAAKLKLDQLVSLIINQYERAFSGIVPFFESLNVFCDKFDAFGNKTLDKF